MAKNENILADSISHIPHLSAFDLLVKKRFSELELDRILIYIIDTVDKSAIPFLASQFDVLGYKGFRLASNESEQREIIKRSIELHRNKGTLWAVREALTSIGYGDALIEEHIENHWANFRVTIELGNRSLNVLEIDDVVKMINEYKNARSHLVDLSYTLNFEDGISLSDYYTDAFASTDIDTLNVGGSVRHNGIIYRNGTRNYSKDADVLNLEIITT